MIVVSKRFPRIIRTVIEALTFYQAHSQREPLDLGGKLEREIFVYSNSGISHHAPTVPLIAPPRDLQIRAGRNDLENPTPTQEAAVPNNPTMITFFRPPHRVSDTYPQKIAVTACDAVKLARKYPTRLEISASGSVGSKLFSC